ncbi:adenosylcobinamide-GDP ribazoletransferase [Inquilinus sp. CAU 1745]|uniref:adenosylcobinamide-GDP ribazoletransferase n=1 Tax=Inquilinus sp. CAU 1745 TaxID=3140369 RepID=UPI00325C19BF
MDSAFRSWARDILAAAIFLTRLPLRWRGEWPPGLHASAQRAFPIVGAGTGLAGGAVYFVAHGVGLPPVLAAIAAVAVQALLTGALHEDGLADMADGLGGGRDRNRKLEIMRDSRIGSYGAIALMLGLAARIGAIAAIGDPAATAAALVASGAASRALLPFLTRHFDPARRDGIAATAGRPALGIALTAGGLAILAAVVAIGIGAGLAAIAVAAAAAFGVAWIARRQLGGYTGDVLGAAQQAAEIFFLLTLVACR